MAASSEGRTLPSWLTSQSMQERNAEGANLPILKFPGKINYHTTVPDASMACDKIRKMLIENEKVVVGFDTEWAVPFVKQAAKQPSTDVVQLCADDADCHVIHLSPMHGFPTALRLLIMDTNIIKVGVGVKNDINKLAGELSWPEDDVKEVVSKSTEELRTLANKIRCLRQNWSLQRLVQHLLQRDLPKDNRIRLGDWTKYPLSDEQIQYAALDAYAGLRIYETLMAET